MDFTQYQELAMRTRPPMLDHCEAPMTAALCNVALGLTGESGEFADSVKKHLFQGHPIDVMNLAEEIGDVLWYCALAASALPFTLDEIAQRNIEKLKKRYPKGFEAERSINRDRAFGEEIGAGMASGIGAAPGAGMASGIGTAPGAAIPDDAEKVFSTVGDLATYITEALKQQMEGRQHQ